MNKTIRQQYRKNSKKSLCKSKTAKKCKKIKGCKHVSGKKRSFCRKIKNKRYNKTKKFKGGEQICSPTNLDPCKDEVLKCIMKNSEEIKYAKLLNNPTKPNSTKTHVPFSPESECSTTNLDHCNDQVLECIMKNSGIDRITRNNAQKLLFERLKLYILPRR